MTAVREVRLSDAELVQIGYAASMLSTLEEATGELRAAIDVGDLEMLMRSERRLLGIGCLLGDRATQIQLLIGTAADQ